MKRSADELPLERRPIDSKAALSMVALCAIWGMQQVAVKAAGGDVSPVLQISLRSGMAALLVLGLMFFRKERVSPSGGQWLPGLAIGVLFAFEFLFVGEALRFTSASHTVMFLYTAPVFAALGLHLRMRSERLRPVQWVGVVLALAGIVITFLGRDNQGGASNILLGDMLALLGGASYGATTVVVRTSKLADIPATQTLLYQLIGAFVILFLVALGTGQTGFHATPILLGSLLFQTVIVSFASFLAWFSLMRKYLASRLGVLSFMTPLFGILFGGLFLHEPLEARFLIGASIVFAGILLVSGYEWLGSLARTRVNAT